MQLTELSNFVKVQELSKALGLSRAGIYNLIRRSNFPQGLKLGRSRRWAVSEVNEWLLAKQRDMKGA